MRHFSKVISFMYSLYIQITDMFYWQNLNWHWSLHFLPHEVSKSNLCFHLVIQILLCISSPLSISSPLPISSKFEIDETRLWMDGIQLKKKQSKIDGTGQDLNRGPPVPCSRILDCSATTEPSCLSVFD